MYIGDDIIDPSLPASTSVVTSICKPLFDKGHTVFIDSILSPDLCKKVTDGSINVAGKVRPIRRDMLHNISTKQSEEREFAVWSVNNIVCLKWKANKVIDVFSSKHATTNITVVRKQKKTKPTTKIRSQEA
jgi:hypothetical protein